MGFNMCKSKSNGNSIWTRSIGVLRMAEITPLPGAPAAVEGVINIQGEVVPVVSTGDVASGSPREESEDARFQTQ